MKVRAVTVFAAIDPSRVAASLRNAGTLAEAVRQALEHNGLEVQTVRLALPPVDTVGTGVGGAAQLHDLALALDTESPTAGFGFVSVGTIDTVTLPDEIGRAHV